MKTLTIKARTLESARGFLAGLASFDAELHEADDGSYLVEITLSGPDCEIVSVLNALEDFVTNRVREPAEVGLAGRTYTLHPADRTRLSVGAAPA
ncbi:MAG TPA: hypothetical protein VGF66_10810 [Gaiellaceae bacterium]|jgi:hypothetical protein